MSKFNDLNDAVIQWADQKGILDKSNPLAQIDKTLEEVLETMNALFADFNGLDSYYNSKYIKVNTKEEIEDGFGDILVTILIGCRMQGINPLDALESAYNVISKRTGKMVNGKFVKD